MRIALALGCVLLGGCRAAPSGPGPWSLTRKFDEPDEEFAELDPNDDEWARFAQEIAQPTGVTSIDIRPPEDNEMILLGYRVRIVKLHLDLPPDEAWRRLHPY